MVAEGANFNIEQKLPGEVHRDDTRICVYEPERGIIRYNLRSTDQLEEDLSQMYGEGTSAETILSLERHKELFAEACLDVLETYGEYFPKEVLDKCFPKIDLKKLTDYDFSNSKIKFFVLNPEDFELYQTETVHPEDQEEAKRISGYAKGIDGVTNIEAVYPSTTRVFDYEKYLSEKHLIIMKEPNTTKNDGSETAKVLEDDLRIRFRHEILHALNIGKLLPKDLEEGAAEYFAFMAGNSHDESHDTVGYESRFSIIYELFKLTEQGGFTTRRTFGTAFIENRSQTLELLKDYWKKRLGANFVNNMLTDGFSTDNAAWFAVDLIHVATKSETPIT